MNLCPNSDTIRHSFHGLPSQHNLQHKSAQPSEHTLVGLHHILDHICPHTTVIMKMSQNSYQLLSQSMLYCLMRSASLCASIVKLMGDAFRTWYLTLQNH